MKNLILIGMSGAGKSTLGVLLAKSLNMAFTDTDLVLQQERQMLLQDMINAYGIEKFKTFEEEMLIGLMAENSVVATGGSVVYSPVGMEALKRHGRIIYLHVGFDEIERRLSDITTRGIVMTERQTLKQLYDEREPLYRTYADLVVDIKGESIERTVEKLIQR